MKKNILFLLLIFFSLGYVNAQFTGVGGKAGYTLHKFNDDIEASVDHGFHVGVFADYEFEFSEFFFLRGGLLFTKKGSKIDVLSPGNALENDFDYRESYIYRAWYLDIPILAGVRYSFSEDMNAYVNIGPSFNIGLFGKTDYKNVSEHPNKIMFPDISETYKTFDYLKRFDISALISAGFSYKNILLEVSYDYGFIPVKKDKIKQPTATNGCFMISIGYKFPLNEGISGESF